MCIASMNTMTRAQKGRRALLGAGIECEIVSLDRNLTKGGCAYGLSFKKDKKEAAVRALEKTGCAYGQILGDKSYG